MIVYRSYKHFDEIAYKKDMADIAHHVGEVFDDIDDRCWFRQKQISHVIYEHAPIKIQWKASAFFEQPVKKSLPLKGDVSDPKFKNRLKKQDWEAYRRVPNVSTKLKSKSVKTLFRFYM